MPSKFKISAFDQTVKVGFNWLSKDLAILLILYLFCLLPFLFMGYALLHAEKVPIVFFLGYSFAFLFICYLGYATVATLFNITFLSVNKEELTVKRKPFFGLEYPTSITTSNFDQLVQKSYLFFFYKVVAKLKDGSEIPVFNYHYYDKALFGELKHNIYKLLGKQTVAPSNGSSSIKNSQTTEAITDLSIYEKVTPQKTKKQTVKAKKENPIKKQPDYPGTMATPAKKKSKAKAPRRQQKQQRTATNQQLVPITNINVGMDQVIFIEGDKYFSKRIFHYHFDDGTKDKVYQIVPRSNRRRFFYLQSEGGKNNMHEERELNYNETKEIGFQKNSPADLLKFEGASYKQIKSKTGYSKSVETGAEVQIVQWLYLSENGNNQQIRIIEGDNIVKIHVGNPVKADYLTVKK